MFKNFSALELATLEKEMALYAYHITMLIHLPAQCINENGEFDNKLQQRAKTRIELEKALLTSTEHFLTQAPKKLKNWVDDSLIQESKKRFRCLIMATDNHLDFHTIQPSLYLFLYSLCRVKAEQSLLKFMRHHHQAIKLLSIKEFNSLCVVAAANHLPDFIKFLGREASRCGWSMDNYSIEPYGDHSIWIACVTPFIATVLSICDNPVHWTQVSINKAKAVLELLLQYHDANPHKIYVVDDVSEQEAMTMIEANSPHTYTIFDSFLKENALTDKGKQALSQLNDEDRQAYHAFIGYLKTLSLTPIPLALP